VCVKCHDCVTGTNRRYNRTSGLSRFCQYHEIKYTIIATICIGVCVCMEREKERREPAGERQIHKDSDGVSESENKRQEKSLKVIFFIEEINMLKTRSRTRFAVARHGLPTNEIGSRTR